MNLIYYYRTKVECAAQCLTISNCDAFRFEDSKVCTLYTSEGLYINQGESNPIDIYMKESDTGEVKK